MKNECEKNLALKKELDIKNQFQFKSFILYETSFFAWLEVNFKKNQLITL